MNGVRRPGRRIAILLLTLAAMAAGAALAIPYAREYVRTGVHVEIEEALASAGDPQHRSGLGRITGKVGSAVGAVVHDQIRVRLRIRNTTLLPARISGVRYKVRIGSHDVGVGRWRPASGAQWFWPGRDIRITALMDPDWIRLTGAGIDALRGHDTVIAVSGELQLRIMRKDLTTPFAASQVGWARE
jgi:hypothetical protein